MTDSYFGKHLSMSEWALRASLPNCDAIVREDSNKRSRLEVLSERIGLPVVRVHGFTSDEILAPSKRFVTFARGCGSTLYAARGRSSESGKPVLRKRAKTLEELTAWIGSVKADVGSYVFNFEQHIDAELATIFVVGTARIAGEAIVGGILALNSGNFDPGEAHAFEFDSGRWTFSPPPPARLQRFLRQALACVRVDDDEVRELLATQLESSFVGAYLSGYFEVISSSQSGLVFIDYNRVMVDELPPLPSRGQAAMDDSMVVEGRVGCAGRVAGRARVVSGEETEEVTLAPNEILVCQFTDPAFLPLMISAAAVVTDVGGVLSHAAIVCRELGKPCVVGTTHGTTRIANRDWIEVNADEGLVRRIAPRDD